MMIQHMFPGKKKINRFLKRCKRLKSTLLLYIFRQAREGASSVFSFGQSKAKQFSSALQKTTFNDVAGVDEAKQELQEVVDFLKHPKKYSAVGARTPKGVLLVGPAGTGKTLLAP